MSLPPILSYHKGLGLSHYTLLFEKNHHEPGCQVEFFYRSGFEFTHNSLVPVQLRGAKLTGLNQFKLAWTAKIKIFLSFFIIWEWVFPYIPVQCTSLFTSNEQHHKNMRGQWRMNMAQGEALFRKEFNMGITLEALVELRLSEMCKFFFLFPLKVVETRHWQKCPSWARPWKTLAFIQWSTALVARWSGWKQWVMLMPLWGVLLKS